MAEKSILKLRSSGLLVFQIDVQFSKAPLDTRFIDVRV